ncbi:MAG: HU family DNA-binding protein [Leptospirillum sp.]
MTILDCLKRGSKWGSVRSISGKRADRFGRNAKTGALLPINSLRVEVFRPTRHFWRTLKDKKKVRSILIQTFHLNHDSAPI